MKVAKLAGVDANGTGTAQRLRGRYLSSEMKLRRARIVEVARQLIEEGGEAALTISRVSELAGVAPRTIYLGFGDKHGLMAAAVEVHMTALTDTVPVSHQPRRIEEAMVDFDYIVRELEVGPEFARTSIKLYFSHQATPDEIATLRSYSHRRITQWLNQLKLQGDLIAGISISERAQAFVRAEYGIFHEWASGQVDLAEILRLLQVNFLSFTCSIVRGPVLQDAQRLWRALEK